MANIKEIRTRINSVTETRKITNAMYVIASIKMRKAKEQLNATKPYFDALRNEIKRIFRTIENIESRYFRPETETDEKGTHAVLVITADKGLAGAYNMSVIKEALKQIEEYPDTKLYVVGEYGRRYFVSHDIEIEGSFSYTAQNPSFLRAREIFDELNSAYSEGKITKIRVIYTDLVSGLNTNVRTTTLLPLHRKEFENRIDGDEIHFEFEPDVVSVLDHIIPSYLTGFIYSALVDSFCCEQSARMTAMDSANKNADELISGLKLKYNHLRQAAITQEISEVSAGAKNLGNNQ
ncbi:MAG: ATP synthase F1 subunit gamma [Clostridia bacterium]|nr:ATP synthase F1 subunit gamma [Clostridia bacterium]